MISLANLTFLLCIATCYVIATYASFEEFLKDQTEESQNGFKDSDLEAAQAEFEALLQRDAGLETTTPMICQPTGTCGFQIYKDIDETPGTTKEWHHRCFCPEGTECIINGPPNMRMEWWRYTCEVVPTVTSTENSESRTLTDLNKRLGSFSVRSEL